MTIRTRIGLLVPSTNSVAEPDFNMLVPSDVTVHTQRMWTTNDLTAENMDSMNADVERAARYLTTAKVDLIAYADLSAAGRSRTWANRASTWDLTSSIRFSRLIQSGTGAYAPFYP